MEEGFIVFIFLYKNALKSLGHFLFLLNFTFGGVYEH